MTTITFSGRQWIGAGVVYRKPGTYSVSDTLAAYLVENHPDEFSINDQAAEATDEPEATQEPQTEPEQAKSLSKMNRTELEAVAAQIGLTVTEEHKTNKDLAEAIKAKQEAAQ